MPGKNLTLIGQTDSVDQSHVASKILRMWPEGDQPRISTASFAQIGADPDILKSCRAAWVIIEQPDAAMLDKISQVLHEADVPAMLTMQDDTLAPFHDYDAGLVIAPPDTPDDALYGMLRTLWSVSGKLEGLRVEIGFLNAHHGGLCEQIDKIDEELRLAAQLQKEFLPEELPVIEGMDFQVMFRPAGYVSGDIYDVERLDEDHVGMFLGDAVGHGVPAALLTIYIKRSMHTKEFDPTLPQGYRLVPPGEAMAKLNRDMCERSVGNVRFATAIYALVNTKTREVTVVRAGHPYPIILHADGTTDHMEPEGAMLGIFAEEEYETATFTLQAGDRFILYSDGFEVAFPEVADPKAAKSGSIANNRYHDEFKDLANGSLKESIRRLGHKMDFQAGSLNQRDDMTIVGLEVLAEEGEIKLADDDSEDLADSTASVIRRSA